MAVQPDLVILDDLVAVEPGQAAHTTVRIRNVPDRVVHYTLSAVPSSPAAPWITIEPDSLRLLESEDGEAYVVIQPPRDASTSAGRWPFAVMADPGPDDEVLPTVVEADVAVGAVYALDARLVPSHGHGRLRGRLRVELTNLGNDDVHVSVAASDDADDEKLHFATADGRVSVLANCSAEAFIKLRPDRPILFGKPVDHSFVVRYRRRTPRTARLSSPDEADDVGAEIAGSWTQRPIIAKWMVALALLVVAIAAVVFVLRRASAAEPVPRAPRCSELRDAEAANDELRLRFEVADAVGTIEVQLVERPVDDQHDLATPTSDVVALEVSGSTVVGTAPLGEQDVATDGSAYFRYRAVAVDGQVSIWNGSSAVVSDAMLFPPPANVVVDWTANNEVQVSWDAPANPDGRTLSYALRRADGSALDVVPDGTTALVPMAGEPFGVQVQVFDDAAQTALSDWSDPVSPVPEERPPETAFSAPTDVRVTWADPATVRVTWTPPADRGDATLTYDFRDEFGSAITEVSQSGNTAILPMGETVVGVEMRATNLDDPEQQSPYSAAVRPEGERPLPTTTTSTTTAPELLTIEGLYILPQAGVGPTAGDLNEWPALWELPPPRLRGVLQPIATAEYDLPDFVPQGNILIATGYGSVEEAAEVCAEFLRRLDGASEGRVITNCWVVDGDTVAQDVLFPPPAATTTTGGP